MLEANCVLTSENIDIQSSKEKTLFNSLFLSFFLQVLFPSPFRYCCESALFIRSLKLINFFYRSVLTLKARFALKWLFAHLISALSVIKETATKFSHSQQNFTNVRVCQLHKILFNVTDGTGWILWWQTLKNCSLITALQDCNLKVTFNLRTIRCRTGKDRVQ